MLSLDADENTTSLNESVFDDPDIPDAVKWKLLHRDIDRLTQTMDKLVARLAYYDKLRYIGYGGMAVFTSIGAGLVWLYQALSSYGGPK